MRLAHNGYEVLVASRIADQRFGPSPQRYGTATARSCAGEESTVRLALGCGHERRGSQMGRYRRSERRLTSSIAHTTTRL